MTHVEHDYEPFLYQQPIYSIIYQNHDQLLLNYYTRPLNNNNTKVKIVRIVDEITEKKPTECSSTNKNYQNIPEEKQSQKEKIWTTPLLLESPKCKQFQQFQTPDLNRFFIRFRSRIKHHQHSHLEWNKNSTSKIIPFKTTSRLATAKRSILTNYGKIQLFLVPTRTMEQNKLMSKQFKQTSHITDIKHNIIGKQFFTKHIPTINILNSRVQIKDKETRMKNTALTFFQRLNKQSHFSLNFTLYTIRIENI